MKLDYLLLSIAVMALTTYLIRMLPLALFRKKLKNPFLQSFLYYIPYAVLTAMTVPAIFSSTASIWSAAAGFLAALIMSYCGRSLMPVALTACAAVFVTEWAMGIF
ncbi:MAG: AzlD domain-containing protein [Oscillospiraceae bacterium]|nr:AzlD domain-containing protein [Oscillospiraceae bacterium]